MTLWDLRGLIIVLSNKNFYKLCVLIFFSSILHFVDYFFFSLISVCIFVLTSSFCRDTVKNYYKIEDTVDNQVIPMLLVKRV